jgi:hypothetical protein
MNTSASPPVVAELEQVFGLPSEAGFGSAVFFHPTTATDSGSLEVEGQAIYRTFCGDLWEKFGAENWLATWELLHERPDGETGDIVTEIEAIRDPEAGSAAQMLLDAGPDPNRAASALRAAFNDSSMVRLQIFKIGDGGAMSGAIIAAETKATARVFLIILLD